MTDREIDDMRLKGGRVVGKTSGNSEERKVNATPPGEGAVPGPSSQLEREDKALFSDECPEGTVEIAHHVPMMLCQNFLKQYNVLEERA